MFDLVCEQVATVLGIEGTNLTRFEDDGTQTVLAGWSVNGTPIFPMGLAWAAETWPGDHRTASWALTASMLGGVVGPAIIAGAVSATNVTVVPAALSTFAALTFVTLLSIRGHSAETVPS